MIAFFTCAGPGSRRQTESLQAESVGEGSRGHQGRAVGSGIIWTVRVVARKLCGEGAIRGALWDPVQHGRVRVVAGKLRGEQLRTVRAEIMPSHNHFRAPSSPGDGAHYGSADRYHHDYTAEQPARTSPNRRRQLSFTQLSAEQQNAQASATRSSSSGGTTSPRRSPPARKASEGGVGSPAVHRSPASSRAARSPDRRGQAGRSRAARSPPPRRESGARLSPPAGPLRAATKLVGDGWLGPTSDQSAEIEELIQKLDRVRSRSAQRGARVGVSAERTRPPLAQRGSPGRRTVHEVYGEHAATNDEPQTQVATVSLELATSSNANVGEFYHHAAAARRQSSAPMPSDRKKDDEPAGQWVGSVPSAGGVWLPSPDGEGLGAKRFASVLERIARRQEMQQQQQHPGGDAAEVAEGSVTQPTPTPSSSTAAASSPQPNGVRLVPILSASASAGHTNSAGNAVPSVPAEADDSDETEFETDFETDTEDDGHPAMGRTEPSVAAVAGVPEMSAALRALVDSPGRQAERALGDHIAATTSESGPQQQQRQQRRQQQQKPPPPPRAADTDGLPSGWSREWSEKSQRAYYWNADTNESRWDPPAPQEAGGGSGQDSDTAASASSMAADEGATVAAASAVAGGSGRKRVDEPEPEPEENDETEDEGDAKEVVDDDDGNDDDEDDDDDDDDDDEDVLGGPGSYLEQLRAMEELQSELQPLTTKKQLRAAARRAGGIDEDLFNEVLDADGWQVQGAEYIMSAKFPALVESSERHAGTTTDRIPEDIAAVKIQAAVRGRSARSDAANRQAEIEIVRLQRESAPGGSPVQAGSASATEVPASTSAQPSGSVDSAGADGEGTPLAQHRGRRRRPAGGGSRGLGCCAAKPMTEEERRAKQKKEFKKQLDRSLN